MDYYMEALQIHEKYRGKMQCSGKMEVRTKKDLSVLYTPGVGRLPGNLPKSTGRISLYK